MQKLAEEGRLSKQVTNDHNSKLQKNFESILDLKVRCDDLMNNKFDF